MYKLNRIPKSWIIAACVVSFLTGLAVSLLIKHSNESMTFDYQKERRLLAHIMATQGSQAAYTHFKTAYTSLPQRYGGSLHILAHWMGATLYDQNGNDGLKYCDRFYIIRW